MRPMQLEMNDPIRTDAIIQFDCRVRRWLGSVPLSTIVILVDAIFDEMQVRARPRRRARAPEAATPPSEPPRPA